MQYKIPVQIENEDPIFLGLSLRQLTILMVGWWIAYSVFTSLVEVVPTEIAFIPSVTIAIVAFLIAVFKHSEMTFIPFILAFARFHTNTKERLWSQWVDSFQPIDIGYVTHSEVKKTENIDLTSKIDKIKELESKINKI